MFRKSEHLNKSKQPRREPFGWLLNLGFSKRLLAARHVSSRPSERGTSNVSILQLGKSRFRKLSNCRKDLELESWSDCDSDSGLCAQEMPSSFAVAMVV